jgi:uncharacterized repeat protein (TIGR04052 family)
MNKLLYLFFLSFTLSSILSCNQDSKKEDNTSALAALALASSQSTSTTATELKFQVVSNGTQVKCGTDITINKAVNGSTSKTLKLQDLRFYVSGLKLVTTDDKLIDLTLPNDDKWQYNNGVLLDFEDKTGDCESAGTGDTNNTVKFNSVTGNFKGVQFLLGLTPDLNKLSNTETPAPFNINAMYWSWAIGYKFSKIEFSSDNIKTSLHIGSLQCSGNVSTNVCAKSFTTTIKVTKDGFDTSKHTVTLDLNELLKNYDTNPTGLTAVSCMPIGTPAGPNAKESEICPKILENVGLKTDGTESGVQSSFSIQ